MKTGRSLNSEEQATWRAFHAASRMLQEQLDRDLLRDAGIPHAYYEILLRLAKSPREAMRMSDLAESSQSSRSRLSHAIARLEESGWVRRETCSTDGRGSYAILTEAGLAVMREATPTYFEGVRNHLFDHLTPDRARLLRSVCDEVIDRFASGTAAATVPTRA